MGVAAGIAGGGVEFGATQERLDDADIGAAFEQMRCKAMTQHMQCDVLPDPEFAAVRCNYVAQASTLGRDRVHVPCVVA